MLDRAETRSRSGLRVMALPALVVVAGLLLPALTLLLLPLVEMVASPRVVDGVAVSPATAFDARWFDALWAQLAFTAFVLAIEVPLGVLVALAMPRHGAAAGVAAAMVAIPLALPQSWFELLRTELLPRVANHVDQMVAGAPAWQPSTAVWEWSGYVLIDAWRYTPLVALLCAFALRRHERLEVAARIDGLAIPQRVAAVHWPRMRTACGLAVLLRLVDSCAAWPSAGSTVSLGAWVRDRIVAGPSATAALAAGLTLLLLLFVPAPTPASDREAP